MKEIITEKDLFYYVFNQSLLLEDKILFLKNSQEYVNEIQFYINLKEYLDTELSDEDKFLIAKKILEYRFNSANIRAVELFPIRKIEHKNSNNLVLRADSENINNKFVHTKTFYDDNKIYIIKVINYRNSSKVFVFSTIEEIIRDFDVVISPHQLRYHLSDNTEPLELDFNIEPESIKIEFNLKSKN